MDIIDDLNAFVGADWFLDNMLIAGDIVQIELVEEKGYHVRILCNGFIGLSYIGRWDESIIEYINVQPEGDLINPSLEAVKRLYGTVPTLGGGILDINDSWYQLNLKLIDGNIIKVVCSSFSMEMPPEQL